LIFDGNKQFENTLPSSTDCTLQITNFYGNGIAACFSIFCIALVLSLLFLFRETWAIIDNSAVEYQDIIIIITTMVGMDILYAAYLNFTQSFNSSMTFAPLTFFRFFILSIFATLTIVLQWAFVYRNIPRGGPPPLLRSGTNSESMVLRKTYNNLKTILADSVAVAYFQKFLISEFTVENLMFLVEAEKFRKFAIKEENDEQPTGKVAKAASFLIANLQDSETTELPNLPNDNFKIKIQTRGKNLHEKFIQESAPYEINLSGITKRQITREVECDEVTENTYSKAAREVFTMMEQNSYPRFILSKFYTVMIDDLKSK